MTVRKLFGTATTDAGLFWADIADNHGWRIQYNRTLDLVTPLKPYRLLDPDSHLWASADTAQELAAAMPQLIQDFSQTKPLFTRKDVAEILLALARKLGGI